MAFITPVTDWVTGDGVTQTDMNRIETNISSLQSTDVVKVPVSGWTNTVPYTQTIAYPGITAADKPSFQGGPDPAAWATATAASVKAARKAGGYIDRAVTGAGTVTLYCYRGKPAVDCWLVRKGV